MSWFACMTLSRQESLADRLLRQQGFRTFFPHTAAWMPKDSRKIDLVKTPMLPRYLFVELGEQPEFWRVNETPGIATVVYAPGGRPWPISERAMELLCQACDPSGLMLYGKPKKIEFAGAKGDMVRLSETTPYFGFIAEIQQVYGEQIVVELQSFNRTVSVTLKPRDISEVMPKERIAV